MVSATQAGFEVTQNRVDPIKFRQFLGLATACNDRPVLTARIGYRQQDLMLRPFELIIIRVAALWTTEALRPT